MYGYDVYIYILVNVQLINFVSKSHQILTILATSKLKILIPNQRQGRLLLFGTSIFRKIIHLIISTRHLLNFYCKSQFKV